MTTDMAAGYAEPTIPGADPATRKPRIALPAGSCDCHAHIFGPQHKYPYEPGRRYTPPDAPMGEYLKMLGVLGVQRAVLVQPSVYGTDNTMMLDALRETDFPLRGIAVIDNDISDAELESMHAAGVRGLRLNLRAKGSAAPQDVAPRVAQRIAPLGWHLQFRINPQDLANAEALIDKLPVPVVVDHIGAVPVEEGVQGKTFQTILGLAHRGRCWIKLSAPMRMSRQELPYPDVLPFVHALVDAAPGQLLWGTDWPHTTLSQRMPNDGDLCDLLAEWIPDAQTRKRVLVDNPAQVYGF
jgi:predicted TIM-barrel fold metal-dependent hydrolase